MKERFEENKSQKLLRKYVTLIILVTVFGLMYFIFSILFPAYSFKINLSERIGSFLGSKGNSNICMKMKKDSNFQYHCYEALINSVKLVEECDLIKDYYGHNGNWKDVCFTTLAGRLKDKDICMKVSDNEITKSGCYSTVAEASLDENICELATNSYSQGSCFEYIAENKNKPNLCFKAGEYKNNCLTEFAYRLRDASLCEDVDNNVNYYYEETPKDRCLRYSKGEKDPVMIY